MDDRGENEPGSPRRIRGVNISLGIVRGLQELGRAGVTELASELGYSKSTIYNHLTTLEDNEFVVKDGDEYRLSLRFLDVAEDVRHQFGNYDVIREEVDALAEETGEIVQFGIPEHGQVSYLYKRTGDRGVQTASRVGGWAPFHSTSLGKAILASMPEERVDEILRDLEFVEQTPNTITSAAELREALRDIADRGYAIDDEENIVGVRCVAAPVQSRDEVFGAISVTGPSSRIQGARLEEEIPELVVGAANVIDLNTKFA